MRRVSPETRALMAWMQAIQQREAARREVRRAVSDEARREAAARLVRAEAALDRRRATARARVSA